VTELVDRAGWESRDLPRGDLHFLVSPANAATRAFHAEVTAQVDKSQQKRCRSKSAICCGKQDKNRKRNAGKPASSASSTGPRRIATTMRSAEPRCAQEGAPILLEPVGPVHWGSYPGDLLERVMSVLLFQERPTAWRRRPSQGDGGLDVGEPNHDGYHVYQIKGFTGSMTPSRRRQIDQSLQRILDDPRLDRPVTA
jgi:hypothetical protein